MLDGPPDEKPPSSPSDARFCVRLSAGKRSHAIVTDDMERLSSVASACRRLRDSASINSNGVESYRWLEPYTLHPSSWLSVKPRNLRYVCQPVHSNLSLGCAGMTVNDDADYVVIRDDWLWSRSLSLATEEKVSEKEQLVIRVGTFNVNGKSPSQDLSTWLGGGPPFLGAHSNERKYPIPPRRKLPTPSLGDKGTPHYGTGAEGQTSTLEADVLVMAFQEVDLSTEALLYFAGSAKEDAWTTAILAALGERAERYEKFISKQLVGILLIVFVKRDLRGCFTGVMESSVAVGVMGIMGNKGAVAVRFGYRPNPTSFAPSPVPMTFTFVNSHLAAFDDHIERRNADFHDIARRMEFGPSPEYIKAPHTEHRGAEPQTLSIYASDVLFWLGDLNYRLNLPDADVRSLVCSVPTSRAIRTLLQFDEASIRRSQSFAGFNEHPITFLPTYRFAPTLHTDAAGYDTKRKPAWTDRILHQFSPFVPVNQSSYDSHLSITMSDHRPVSAEFLVDIPCIDSMALDLATNDLLKSIATFDPENPLGIPLLKLDKSVLDFGKVSYSTHVSQNLTIQNAGKIPAAFRFFPRDLSSPIHPRWLKIEPMAGFLLPGEEKTLQLTIFVSRSTAAL
ncbi:Endonuclease/exonuclease/phosphatase [Russula compacta]|nr:Endonuclease/exonuclease/phosphatase [Russula compacta]